MIHKQGVSVIVFICLLYVVSNISGQSPVPPQQHKEAASDTATVSEKGRFRITFPAKPIEEDENYGPRGMYGFSLREGNAKWSAHCIDFPNPTTDEDKLREAYSSIVEALLANGSRLVRKDEIRLNGKLGIEFVIEKRGEVSFLRAFLVGRRLYTLGIRRKAKLKDSATPAEVQKFFDSFDFWEVSRLT
jgi:hypothetical protein